jgi:DNA-binding response OmpR family regulator
MMVPKDFDCRLSVLVVDDYPDAAASLVLVLEMEGFAARTAMSGEEALAAAAAEPPDVLILEPRTVGCGWGLPRRMADSIAGRRPLLVVFTTDTTLAGRRAALAAGVGLYVVKPADPALLIGVLRHLEDLSKGPLRFAATYARMPPGPGTALAHCCDVSRLVART